jgi:nucleoside-diphosphate-sugar epimerase
VAQPVAFDGRRVSRERAETYRRDRLTMDRLLLDALAGSRVRRVVYVGGTSYYGDDGATPKGEDTPPNPRGWGPYLAPAIHALDTYIQNGLPIVSAFPGVVYGEGSWFRQYVHGPLRRRQKMNVIGPSRVWSPVHIDDCARAISLLRERGEIGARYFIVDDRPGTMEELCRRTAGVLGVPYATRRIPVWLARLLLGPIVVDSMQSDAALSNARLRGLGFQPRFPTIDEGIPDIVARLQARRR